MQAYSLHLLPLVSVQQTQNVMFRNVSMPQGSYVLNKLCIQVAIKGTITKQRGKVKKSVLFLSTRNLVATVVGDVHMLDN